MVERDKFIYIYIISAIGAGNTTFVKAVIWLDRSTGPFHRLTVEERFQWKKEGRSISYGHLKDDDMVKIMGIYVLDKTVSVMPEEYYHQIQNHMAGLILLLDSTRPETFEESWAFSEYLRTRRDVPFFVVANKQDLPAAMPVHEIRKRLPTEEDTKVFSCVATNTEMVSHIVHDMLNEIDHQK